MNKFIHTFKDGTMIELTSRFTDGILKFSSNINIREYPHLFSEYKQWRDEIVVPSFLNIKR